MLFQKATALTSPEGSKEALGARCSGTRTALSLSAPQQGLSQATTQLCIIMLFWGFFKGNSFKHSLTLELQ